MKKMILVTLAFLSLNSASAFVGNDGPQATPELQNTIVERFESGGFFVPPGALLSKALRIQNDGTVTRTEYIRGDEQNPSTQLVTQLSASQLAKVKALVQAVRAGDMVDPNPSAPMCEDAPYSRDSVYQNNTRIDIAERSGCKNMVHQNATKADAKLIAFLNAIEKM